MTNPELGPGGVEIHLCPAIIESVSQGIELECFKFSPTDTVTIGIVKVNGIFAMQMDYCPWCKEQLSAQPIQDVLAQKKLHEQAQRAYEQYRKRFVKTGKAGEPMSREKYEIVKALYEEMVLLLPHAKPEHKASLSGLYLKAIDQLCLMP